MEDHNFWQG